MSQYYYQVSALPTVSLDSEQFPSEESFLEMCSDWMDPSDLGLIQNTRLNPTEMNLEPKNGLLNRWFVFESELRNESARIRGQKLKKDPTQFLRTDDSGVYFTAYGTSSDGIKSAVQESSPYQGEKLLNQIRWSFLDELSVGHIFSIEALQIYYLKLQILSRISNFKQKLGEERFQVQYQTLSAKIAEADQPNI